MNESIIDTYIVPSLCGMFCVENYCDDIYLCHTIDGVLYYEDELFIIPNNIPRLMLKFHTDSISMTNAFYVNVATNNMGTTYSQHTITLYSENLIKTISAGYTYAAYIEINGYILSDNHATIVYTYQD